MRLLVGFMQLSVLAMLYGSASVRYSAFAANSSVMKAAAQGATAWKKDAAARASAIHGARRLLQTDSTQGLFVQAYVPYKSRYVLPIPADAVPSFLGSVPNISFPDVSDSALFDLAGGATEHFALRFTGNIKVPDTTTYTFSMDNDDGALLYIDGHETVKHTGKHGFNGYTAGTVLLSSGLHDIEIDYFQAGGLAGISLRVAYSEVAAMVVPSSWVSYVPPPQSPPPSPGPPAQPPTALSPPPIAAEPPPTPSPPSVSSDPPSSPSPSSQPPPALASPRPPPLATVSPLTMPPPSTPLTSPAPASPPPLGSTASPSPPAASINSPPLSPPSASPPPPTSGRSPITVAYENPVIDRNFPDPGVIKLDDGTYYAFGTNDVLNVQAAVSSDLVHWTLLDDALPVLPTWSVPGLTWAPQPIEAPNGGFLLYHVAHSAALNVQCTGVATSPSPSGPYAPVGDHPIVCQDPLQYGGTIDPAPYTAANGTRYLLYKNDGNAIGVTTYIWLHELTADGTATVGDPMPLIHNDQSTWEGGDVEGPFLWEHDGTFYLFYSANSYFNDMYAIGYAVAPALEGPYTKPLSGPWLATSYTDNGQVISPGGQNVVTGPDGADWLVYHSKEPTIPGLDRRVCIAPITWTSSGPTTFTSYRVPELSQ